ncbi:BLOC-1 related complex subunit 6 [Osmerus eperlanus]|uniref:BLOC-1 related complex subunit 6 n=1 Tax=Osmerus eperlanus TaxID=29151 RepID=UPI002E15ED6D
MSLSPVIGQEVPEAANGVSTPDSPDLCSANGLLGPAPGSGSIPSWQPLKCGGRVPCPGQDSEEVSVGEPGICLEGETPCESDGYTDTAALNSYADTQTLTTSSHPNAQPPATCTADTEPSASPPDTLHSAPHQSDESRDDAPSESSAGRQSRHTETAHIETDSCCSGEEGSRGSEGEKEKQDDEGDEKKEREEKHGGGVPDAEDEAEPGVPSLASSAPPAPPPPPAEPDSSPCPPHVMAQVRVRNVPERERLARGMQDSKSLDEISQACGGAAGGGRGGGRGGQPEGRRATISSALELEGTVSHDGDLTHFITRNLEQKIKMSSKPSLDCDCESERDSDCSGPIYRGRGSLRRPADIPPIDPAVLLDLERHTQEVAHSVEMMMRSLNGTIQNMTALSVGYIQTYRDSVDSLGESVDMSIKGMYTLMARCEELDRSMQPIHTLAAQIRDVKRTLDALEAICK